MIILVEVEFLSLFGDDMDATGYSRNGACNEKEYGKMIKKRRMLPRFFMTTPSL